MGPNFGPLQTLKKSLLKCVRKLLCKFELLEQWYLKRRFAKDIFQ
jgi:hypothetical protein